MRFPEVARCWAPIAWQGHLYEKARGPCALFFTEGVTGATGAAFYFGGESLSINDQSNGSVKQNDKVRAALAADGRSEHGAVPNPEWRCSTVAKLQFKRRACSCRNRSKRFVRRPPWVGQFHANW